MNEIDIRLDEFADGALREKFLMEFEKVLANMQDPNTEWKKPRELVIKMKMTMPDENRDMFNTLITTTSKLSPSKDAQTKVLMGMDGKGGYAAAEYKNQIPGQLTMRINEDEIVDTETGEVIEKSGKVSLYK